MLSRILRGIERAKARRVFDRPAAAAQRRVRPRRERMAALIEALEPRQLLSSAPTLEPIPDVVLNGGSPLSIALDGFDADGQDITYTAVSDNPSLVSTLIPQGNRSIRITVPGYGEMILQLREDLVPRATGRIVELAQAHFYDGLKFHRVIDGFVIQGGDPLGDGSGGSTLPDFDDQFNVNLQHNSAGILSWAKSLDDTNNSQFFITDGPARHLDAQHSIAGFLIEGYDVLDAISAVPVDGADAPLTDVIMQTVDVFTDNENGLLMISAPDGVFGTTTVTVTAEDEDGNTTQQMFTVSVEPDFIPFEVTGDKLVVEMTNGGYYLDDSNSPFGTTSGGTVVADTIRIQELAPGPGGLPAPILLDTADAGFEIVNGTWTTNPDGTRQTDAWDGADIADIARARWTFDGLTPGQYRVSATWPATVGGASRTLFFVLDGPSDPSPLGPIDLSEALRNEQKDSPTDFSWGGTTWNDITPFSLQANTAPWLEDIPDVRTPTDTPVDFYVTAVDVEGDPSKFLDEATLDVNSLPVPARADADLAYDADFNGEPDVDPNKTKSLVTVIPTNGLTGVHQITLAAGVNTDAIDYQVVNIIIGEPTIQSPIDDVAVDQDAPDTLIDLNPHFDEPGGQDDLVYTVETNTDASIVTATINDNELTLSYAPGMTGSADVTVRATDPIGSFIDQTFTVTVRQVVTITDPGFAVVSGLWNTAGDVKYKAAGTGTGKVRWTFNDLKPGIYQVSVTWSEDANRATNTPFSVLDGPGDATPQSVPVDQEQAPADFTEDGTDWHILSGSFVVSGNTLVIEMTDDANEFVIAGSAHVIQVGDLTAPVVIDVTDSLPDFEVVRGVWSPFTNATYGDGLFKNAGDGTSKVRWTFGGLTPGVYQVVTTWTPESNRAVDASYSIYDGVGDQVFTNVEVNQELAPDSLTVDGMAWETLAHEFVVTGDTLIVELDDGVNPGLDDGDGSYLIAGSMRIQRLADTTPPANTAVVKITDPGFNRDSGVWGTATITNLPTVGTIRYKFGTPAGTGSTVSWTFDGLTPGTYSVATSWIPEANRASDAPYSVYDGTGDHGPTLVDVNQELAPNDFNDQGMSWETLVTDFQVTGDSLIVTLGDHADQYVIAGPVWIQRTGDITPPPGETPILLQVTDPGFAVVAGSWNSASTGVGPIRYNAAGSGSDQVTWTFSGLTAGQYRVSTTWHMASAGFANDAPFTLFDGLSDPSPLTVDVNQELVPSDFNDGGVTWHDVAATFDVTGDSLVVRLTDDAEGYVIAGSVRIQRLGDL